jgi:hypothetical protein
LPGQPGTRSFGAVPGFPLGNLWTTSKTRPPDSIFKFLIAEVIENNFFINTPALQKDFRTIKF